MSKKDPVEKLFLECLDELAELSEVVVEEWSSPDVVQEYLQNVVDGYYARLQRIKRRKAAGPLSDLSARLYCRRREELTRQELAKKGLLEPPTTE
ncbi:hypothetical protein Desku_0730 [Desulfofundulus kuznetsovii DSM 6115]|uniref:Uncharacterized protein n=1 Tax=Desulfofundulus kuznetsovii (strain DSM 6115 / VKM B-1805 / 17) TaxID=760568 RepID=A0AAU8PLN0_DESK7|nr:hypothetical protein Desku_0730 [Desulfofundulus kuznetsovii DSM 6115]